MVKYNRIQRILPVLGSFLFDFRLIDLSPLDSFLLAVALRRLPHPFASPLRSHVLYLRCPLHFSVFVSLFFL